MTDGIDQKPHSIDAGLPEVREDWPSGVLEALRQFSQGDVLVKPPLFYYADPAKPVWARTRAYLEGAVGPEIVEAGPQTQPRFGIITTQTCDIAEEDAPLPVRPWVQISPVYNRSDLAPDVKSLLRKGRGLRYLLHLPALPDGFWVADLRIEVPVEKGWLAGATRIDGFGDEELQRRVGERVSLLRRRPAFSGTFVEAVQKPLVMALRQLRVTDRSLFNDVDATVVEVGVAMDSHLRPSEARLTLITDAVLSDAVAEWWGTWWDAAHRQARERGFRLHALDVRSLDDLSAREYRDLTVVPLDRISPQ